MGIEIKLIAYIELIPLTIYNMDNSVIHFFSLDLVDLISVLEHSLELIVFLFLMDMIIELMMTIPTALYQNILDY